MSEGWRGNESIRDEFRDPDAHTYLRLRAELSDLRAENERLRRMFENLAASTADLERADRAEAEVERLRREMDDRWTAQQSCCQSWIASHRYAVERAERAEAEVSRLRFALETIREQEAQRRSLQITDEVAERMCARIHGMWDQFVPDLKAKCRATMREDLRVAFDERDDDH